jgi:hypothetical protein
MGKKRQRYSHRFQFQVVLEMLSGEWDARRQGWNPQTNAYDVDMPGCKPVMVRME